METHPIIPAAPGWFLLHPDPDTGELFAPEPVLAWEVQSHPLARHDVDPFLRVEPLTVNGRGDTGYLLHPDGVVEDVGSQTWLNLDKANAPAERDRRRALISGGAR